MKKLLAVFAVAACAAICTAASALADPAVVFNPSNNDGLCSNTTDGGTYQGDKQVEVFKDGALVVLHCTPSQISGSSPDTAFVVQSGSCTNVASPGGVAPITCTKP